VGSGWRKEVFTSSPIFLRLFALVCVLLRSGDLVKTTPTEFFADPKIFALRGCPGTGRYRRI
jgi:hypothetical protein